MTEKQIDIENGTISYRTEQEKAIVTGFRGFAANLSLPSRIQGYPVTAIDRKAFLSQKSLWGICLPDTVQEVGDWAFAHCGSLAEISFPKREVRFGRAVFKDCGSLQRIVVREPDCGSGGQTAREDSRGEALGKPDWGMSAPLHDRLPGESAPGGGEKPSCAELLAAAVTMLEAPYLLDVRRAGSREWLEQWDIRLLSVLRAADAEGYISQSVYGEEDYIGTDLEEFTGARRRTKVRLSFLRLLRPQHLHPALREELEQYLRSLTKGRSTEETWEVIRQEHGSHREHYSLFAQLGCITEDNFQGILEDMGEDNPEMKAFFLKYRGERREGEGDFFDALEL